MAKTKEEILAGMDADGKLAKEEFLALCNTISVEDVEAIRSWWERWYPKAGHKRLAYILLGKS